MDGGSSDVGRSTRPTRIDGFRNAERRTRTPVDRARDDLGWYFNQRECALGLKSAGVFGDVDASTDDDPIAEEAILRHIQHERPIRRALLSLTWQTQRVLEAFFTDHERPHYPLVSKAFDPDVARVVHLTDEARALATADGAVFDALERALKAAAKAKDNNVRNRLDGAATLMVTAACSAYVAARVAS